MPIYYGCLTQCELRNWAACTDCETCHDFLRHIHRLSLYYLAIGHASIMHLQSNGNSLSINFFWFGVVGTTLVSKQRALPHLAK
jgi:hypothetical protein